MKQRSHTVPNVPSIITPYANDPNLAATKIQANFRGYLTRKEFSLHHPHLHHHHTHQIHGEPGTERLSRDFAKSLDIQPDYQRRKQKGLIDISNQEGDEKARRNRAATRIQATYRGYHVRTHLPHNEKLSCSSSPGSARSGSPYPSEDDAATKIQAAFRGYQVRKKFRSHTVPIRCLHCGEYEDEKYDEAAKKIQANFRGYKVRKEYNLKHSHH